MGKTNILKADGFEDLVKRLNPFGIRNIHGEPMAFSDYGECYLYVLKKLHEMFPRGFIDVPLFLQSITQVPFATAKMFADKFPFLKTENDMYVCAWSEPDSNPKYKAEMLMRALHTLSETNFSYDFFNYAWDKFMNETP